jgi:hypothetical protein
MASSKTCKAQRRRSIHPNGFSNALSTVSGLPSKLDSFLFLLKQFKTSLDHVPHMRKNRATPRPHRLQENEAI